MTTDVASRTAEKAEMVIYIIDDMDLTEYRRDKSYTVLLKGRQGVARGAELTGSRTPSRKKAWKSETPMYSVSTPTPILHKFCRISAETVIFLNLAALGAKNINLFVTSHIKANGCCHHIAPLL